MKNRKGFTLIELLVVIAIIAVLSVVVILSLNPAELLRQARDSNRISDMATIKSAISLYLSDVSTPNLASSSVGTSPYLWAYYSQSNATTVAAMQSSSIKTTDILAASTTGTSSRLVDATGWIPVNFSLISSGSPIGSLPVDPVNSTSSFDSYGTQMLYGYAATSSNLSFKLTAHMESGKYKTGGGADVQTSDGGNSVYVYEQGTILTL